METYLRVSWRLVKTSYHFLWSASCSSGISAFKKFGNLLLIGWRTITGGSEFSSMAYLNIYNDLIQFDFFFTFRHFSIFEYLFIVYLFWSHWYQTSADHGLVNSKNNQIWQFIWLFSYFITTVRNNWCWAEKLRKKCK